MKNKAFILFSTIRIVMFVLLSSFFFSVVDSLSDWRTAFISISIILFIVAHFVQFSISSKRVQIGCNALDFILSAGFGFFFTEVSGTIYLIFFGVIATTVFLTFSEKFILLGFSFAFVITWTFVSVEKFRTLGEFSLSDNLLNFMFIFYCSIVGRLIKNLTSAREIIRTQYTQLNSSHEALQIAHDRLAIYSDQVEQLTVIRERNEIAREIHDTVGHKMTAMLVQMQLAGELMEKSDRRTKELLQTCEQLARDALHEIRMSVRTLKDEVPIVSIPFHQMLKSMLDDFSQLTGLEVNFDTMGNPNCISTPIRPVIKRIIQEALTNTKRHSDATQCTISLSVNYNNVELHIKDNGTSVISVVPGFGLNSMKERVHEQGGVAYFEALKEGGLLIQVEFPHQKNPSENGVSI